jgi:hypothetical protein
LLLDAFVQKPCVGSFHTHAALVSLTVANPLKKNFLCEKFSHCDSKCFPSYRRYRYLAMTKVLKPCLYLCANSLRKMAECIKWHRIYVGTLKIFQPLLRNR